MEGMTLREDEQHGNRLKDRRSGDRHGKNAIEMDGKDRNILAWNTCVCHSPPLHSCLSLLSCHELSSNDTKYSSRE